MRYLRFQKLDGSLDVFPRAHLRWIELAGEETLRIGFSSETLVITDRNLGQLARDIITAKTEVISQNEERHLTHIELDVWVKTIISQAHARSQ